MRNVSYENEFYSVNENSFSHEMLCIKSRFEKELQENTEMANKISGCHFQRVAIFFIKSSSLQTFFVFYS